MAIQIVCPTCGGKAKVADHHSGRRGKCPHCSALILVPTPQVVETRPAVGNPGDPPPVVVPVPLTPPADSPILRNYPNSPILKLLDRLFRATGGSTHNPEVGRRRVLLVLVGVVVALTLVLYATQAIGGRECLGVFALVTLAFLVWLWLAGWQWLWTQVFTARSWTVRIVAILIGICVIVGINIAWKPVLYAINARSARPPQSFAEVEKDFGVENPLLTQSTATELDAKVKTYLGKRLRMRGFVWDVQEGRVFLVRQPRLPLLSAMQSPEVSLVVGWWDTGNLRSLKKGDLIEFSGTVTTATRATLFPIELGDGWIEKARTITDSEAKELAEHGG